MPKTTKKRKTTKKPTAALARVEKTPLAPQSVAPSIERTVERIEQVRRFVKSGLNVGLQQLLKRFPKLPADDRRRAELMIDYGTIPGVNKNFLLQPGAEKICLWLNVRPVYDSTERELPDGHLEVIARCRLLAKQSGEEMFSGPSCSCSSMETKFRYRFEKRDTDTIPAPDDQEAKKLKSMGLGKWVKNKFKKGNEPNWFWFDRIENRDIADVRNNVRQMAHKRALVKVVRNFGAMSEIFTEDPTEWNFDDAGGEPDAIEQLQRTPGGREIIEHPAGQQLAGTKAAAEAVAERKKAEYQAKQEQTLTEPPKPVLGFYRGKAGKVAFLTPPQTLSEAAGIVLNRTMSEAKELCLSMGFWDDEQKFGIDVRELPSLQAVCLKNGVELKEFAEPRPSPAQGAGSTKPADNPGDGKEPTETHSKPSAVPSAGKLINWTKEGKTKTQLRPVLEINWGGTIYSCFRKSLWPHLTEGKGKPAELILSEDHRNVIGITSIDGRQYEEGLPTTTNDEIKPSGTADLFWK
jgi:hypothetical protein